MSLYKDHTYLPTIISCHSKHIALNYAHLFVREQCFEGSGAIDTRGTNFPLDVQCMKGTENHGVGEDFAMQRAITESISVGACNSNMLCKVL